MNSPVLVAVSVVIPTFNEAENIFPLCERISQALISNDLSYEIIIIDDGSADKTAAAAKALQRDFPIQVIERSGPRGLSESVIEGFAAARGEVVVVMDADLSHPPEKVPALLAPIFAGESEAAVGSRYIRGGGFQNWPRHRMFLSRIGGFLARGIVNLSDPMTGFMAIRKSCLAGHQLQPVGWKIVLEVLARTNVSFVEIPFQFADRVHGESKLSLQVQIQYLHHLWRLYENRIPTLMQLVEFSLVGLSGVFVDTGVLIFGVEILSIYPRASAVLAFLAAVCWNFWANSHWTFSRRNPSDNVGQFARFVLVCLLGLSVRLTTMGVLLEQFSFNKGRWYIFASAAGLALAMIVNFLGSKFFVFERTADSSVRRLMNRKAKESISGDSLEVLSRSAAGGR